LARAWFVATGGTLFIVELYDLLDRDQAQLLRLLESRDSRTSVAPCRAAVRVVAATRIDLATTPSPANLRSSLFHRLNVLHVHIPQEGASAVDSADGAPQSYSTFKEEKTRLLEAWEPTYLRELLSQVGGNLALAARTAGIARAHLYRLLKKYRLAR
jgi:DNA-binding NtrC family response regulator